jgi:hypothetical protein
MKRLYVGRHANNSQKARDAQNSTGAKPQEQKTVPAGRQKLKRIAFWVGMGICLAVSLAVIAGLVQGYYEMDHPPDGWCQDDSPKCVKP